MGTVTLIRRLPGVATLRNGAFVMTVASVAPNNGPTAGNTPITVTGTNFSTATAVYVRGVDGILYACTNVLVTNSTTITCNTPAHASGLTDVIVTAPLGSGTGVGLWTYGFSATSIAGCKLWLRGSLGVTLNGSAVSAWADQSGNANHYTQVVAGNQPANNTGNIGGQAAITLQSGSFQYLNGPGFGSLTAADIFFVLKTSGPGANTIAHASLGSSAQSWYPFSDGHAYLGEGSTGRPDCGAVTNLENAHVLEEISTSAEFTTSRDGTQFFTIASNTVGWAASSLLGAGTPAATFDGLIAEVIIYDHKLSAPDRATVMAGLRALYGTP